MLKGKDKKSMEKITWSENSIIAKTELQISRLGINQISINSTISPWTPLINALEL